MSILTRKFEHSSAVIVPVAAGIMLGLLVISSPVAAICAILGGFVAVVMGRDPLNALGVLILVVPFLGIYWLSQNLTSLPGTKPYQLLAVLVAVTAIWNYHRAYEVPRWVLAFTILFLLFFAVCILRALPQLEYMAIKGGEAPTITKFLLSDYFKPLIFFLPFIIIIMYCRSADELDKVVRYLAASTVGLAIFLLYLYFFRSTGDRDVGTMGALYIDTLGFHRNELGSLLMVSFPFLIARIFINRNISTTVALLLTVTATGLLFSRTAYVTMALTPIIYALVSRRAKMVPMVAAVALVFFVLASANVWQRATHRLDSGDLDSILAGRVNHVWLPVWDEYLEDPVALLFGRGRYAIVSTAASQRGHILEVRSAHSMYFEQVLDVGLVGLIFMLAFLASVLRRFVKTLGEPGDFRLREYRYAVAVSAICYFIGGLTGRSLFPRDESSFFWIMMAIAVVIPLVDRSAERQAAEGALAPPDSASTSASEQ